MSTTLEIPHSLARSKRPRRVSGGRSKIDQRRAARERAQQTPGAHTPVLASELIDALTPLGGGARPGSVAIDCTFGDGGHARLLAEHLGTSGTLIAIDRDPLAEQRVQELASELPCTVRFIRSGYAEALELLAQEGIEADVAYFDLGMSSAQLDARERGFSYAYDAPLDMRMDPTIPDSAREIVAEWDERRLAQALREYGEERHAHAIAREIVRRRERAPIETTHQLVEAIGAAMPAPARFAGGHPAKRSFQALRIAVNDEIGQLERALPLAWRLLRRDGVLAAISFHSLEDRRVKRFLAERARGCVCPPELPVCVCGKEPEALLHSRRAVMASAEEIERNPRASSARLRAARKLTVTAAATGAGESAP
jgi:16S rRNA (cytosine1402-N4)-methyltransferase